MKQKLLAILCVLALLCQPMMMTVHHALAESVTTPTDLATAAPTTAPTDEPTAEPTAAATEQPTAEPTAAATEQPTAAPTDEPTAEPTAAATEQPTAAPTDEPTVAPTAAATEQPTAEPTAEPTAKPAAKPVAEPTAEPAHEHAYDDAFVSNNDGTHSKVCVDCGEGMITENCQLVTVETGLMTSTSCATCGYAVCTFKGALSALAVENVASETKVVEKVTIAAADEAAEEVIPASAVLTVNETTFELPVALSADVKGTVAKMFVVTLTNDDESIQPTGAVKLSLPMDEETIASLEGKVLMLMREDGTLVEVAFEIIDGELVFVTEEVGVFLFMEQEEAA